MFIVETLIENRSKTTTRILNTQIRGTRYFLHILAQVMPKFTKNFGMTFAKKWTNREPEICRNGNESTFRQNIGHSDIFRQLAQKFI